MSETFPIRLTLPLSETDVKALHIGDTVLLSGQLITARDAAHKWLTDVFIKKTIPAAEEDIAVEKKISGVLKNGAIYHCGPLVRKTTDGGYQFIAAGPTTSIREEVYQADLIRHYGIKAIIGKGGMGEQTLQACREASAVYLHATGGAAVVMASCVKEVLGVFKIEFGIPEAIWLIRVEELPLVVSMDSYGNSLHDAVRNKSFSRLDQ